MRRRQRQDVDGFLSLLADDVLTNAIQFSPAGSRVMAGIFRNDGKAVVEVRDNGTGMTAEQIGAVGDLFLRGDPMKARRGGSGLGLAISEALVALHGGTTGS